MTEQFLANWDLALSILAGFITLIVAIVQSVKKKNAYKKATTTEERQKVLNDIKSDVYGLISAAEELFSDIPKSGVSKLKYVLNHVKDLCEGCGIEFNSAYWTDFINDVIFRSNVVTDSKALESEKAHLIDEIKSEVPFFKEEADKLFKTIPDSEEYKIEYILKNISVACEKHDVNVFEDYDWKTFVKALYEKEVA